MNEITPAPAGTVLRVIGVLLIAQAVVRLALVAGNAMKIPATVLHDNPFVLAVSFVIPTILGAATLAAGILMVRLTPSARSIGLAICAVCLAYQAYLLGFGLFRATTTPNLPVAWGFLLLSFGYLVLFAAAVICLYRWQPEP